MKDQRYYELKDEYERRFGAVIPTQSFGKFNYVKFQKILQTCLNENRQYNIEEYVSCLLGTETK